MNTIKALFTAILGTLFIYLSYFGVSNIVINTICSLTFIMILFHLNKKQLFFTGFFVGIFWFWWIGYSFVYYDLSYLIVVVLIGIGLVYGLLFYLLGILQSLWYKVAYLVVLSYIHPFGFNWYVIELLFVESFIGITKFDYILVLTATAFFIYIYNNYSLRLATGVYMFIISCIILLQPQTPIMPNESKKIYLASTNVLQSQKWKKSNQNLLIEDVFQNIQKAIENKYDIIIFPETALPLVLNHHQHLIGNLKEQSKKIGIIVGSLYEKDHLLYNSSYGFYKGEITVANKVVLVPFGEAVPLPQKLRDFINDKFYNGAKDYEVALIPTTFEFGDFKIRNAICYEATTDKIYENLDTQYIVAISNNGWFIPSIQPTLQKLLLKYYAKKYSVKIFSVTNGSGSDVIN
ncbi:MAG: apolipoprotein N-acyltransferase [Campylobacterales bacterium]|nr:apolipoprotein N-acyltransferase [Campylobacterales bacterium]